MHRDALPVALILIPDSGSGFRVSGFGFQGSGIRIQDSVLRFHNLGFVEGGGDCTAALFQPLGSARVELSPESNKRAKRMRQERRRHSIGGK